MAAPEPSPAALPVALPPDPNTRPPHWTLPAGACDTHFHVFGPPDSFPFAATRRYEPPAVPVEHYWTVQKITGLSRAIAVQPTAHGFDNAAILDAEVRSEGRMRGVVCIDEKIADATLAEMKAAGVRGARFSLMSDRAGSAAAIESQLGRIESLGWSLVLHIEPQFLLAHEDFIRALPVPMVIDHMARIDPGAGLDQPAFQLLLDLLRDARFWTKICCVDKISTRPQAHVADGLPFADVIPFARAVIEAAPDRVIWGVRLAARQYLYAGPHPQRGRSSGSLGRIRVR